MGHRSAERAKLHKPAIPWFCSGPARRVSYIAMWDRCAAVTGPRCSPVVPVTCIGPIALSRPGVPRLFQVGHRGHRSAERAKARNSCGSTRVSRQLSHGTRGTPDVRQARSPLNLPKSPLADRLKQLSVDRESMTASQRSGHAPSSRCVLCEFAGILPGLTNPSDRAKRDERGEAHQPDDPCQVAVVGAR